MVDLGGKWSDHRWATARNAAAAFCLCACAGCTQGPDYERPVVAVPTTYRFNDAVPMSSAQPETAGWWRAFGDKVLEDLVRECLANNRDLRIATARVDEFAAVLAGTRSQAFPQVGYGLSASRQRASERGSVPFPAAGDPVSSSFSAVLSASWEIDLWGRIRRETEAARANLLASEEARRGVVLTLVASVIVGYITLLDLDSRLETAQATVAGRTESVKIFRMRREGGAVSDYEMSLVVAEYESAVAAVPELKRAIAQQEDALSILLGRNPGPIKRGQDLHGLRTPTVPVGLPADLLTRRPDVLQAEQQLIASNALIGAARALFFPRISLTGVGGFASAALENLFTGPARTWSFVGEIAGPLFTGGGLTAATDQAVARREQALAAYELTVQNAFRDVEDSLVAVQTSRDAEESLARRVEALERAVILARYRYDNGYADYLDVLDTERSLFSAQLSLAAARGDNYRALANVYRALGGDWIDPATGMSATGAMADGPTEQRP
ncbi:efflux transporter outer membrane subunit [Sphingomonas sp. LaA6.9]|uniref:efflux transporter outer membrane subunit n=1 Tax=Sphingomonas sp. LaA6.9 TaxID=2919914 RepID=UPI001F5018CD|nr:efflux transporter outer membrane subunit [Sphingomonas sp. LaA6.9]MCJ8156640.1 efflux transporter outer membrane subunit [Sphingomonas sp. LaA6.9]